MYRDRNETEVVRIRASILMLFYSCFYKNRVLSDQEREEKYGSRRKRFRENHVSEEDPEIYRYVTKDEKTLIEDIAHALYQSRA